MKNNKISIKNRIYALREKINHFDHHYYVLDKPIISDKKYDILFQKLMKTENEYPEFIDNTSPTQRVGGKPVSSFKKVQHNSKMLSLSNVFNEIEMTDWIKKIHTESGIKQTNVICEPKIDGLAVNLLYQDGQLIQAATRGDGQIGEDVTSNIRTIRELPLSISTKESITIRGEIYIQKDELMRINKERTNLGLDRYMNPRNLAAGTVRQLDPRIAAQRKLKLFTYQIINHAANNDLRTTHMDNLDRLIQLGFPVNNLVKKVDSIKGIIKYCKNLESIRDDLDYEIDGAVIKIDSLKIQKKLGERTRNPKWATAYKFKSERKITILKNIHVTVGRTGSLTPVATLESIKLGGVTVTHATLHNENYINENKIAVGNKVLVERSGDVIPKIVGVKENSRVFKKYKIPNDCPSCKKKIQKNLQTSEAFCTNIDCHDRLIKKIIYFVSKDCMNIKGLGSQIIEKLINEKIIRNISDIYKLNKKVESMILLDKMGKKLVGNLLNEVELSKQLPFHKVLTALGIQHVGSEIALLLVNSFKNIDNIVFASHTEFEQIEGIGPKVSTALQEYFLEKDNLKIIDELKKTGLKMAISVDPQRRVYKANYFMNKNIALTGTLEKWSREEMFNLLSNLGGTINKSVTKKTSILIVGLNPGNKLEIAKKNNIEQINEKKLIELLD
jgi:DNA ligase (NAD+)